VPKTNGSTRIDLSKRLSRLQVMLTGPELRALDEFRFQKRMPSRASAIREILRRGLAADGFVLADGEARSGEFGVLQDSSDSKGVDHDAAAGANVVQVRRKAAP
jgi:metal-responsive CopG/Arc/MetJ family transcriptional regulator